MVKHLAILEDAGLVVVVRKGREKHHFLNVVPIREIHDRWVTKYTETWASGLAELKRDLERTMEKVFEIHIRTTPERLWEAITDPLIRAKYHFGAGVHSDWTLTVFLGIRSMRELGLRTRPPWAHAYLLPLNALRYSVLGRTAKGRARLERRGERNADTLLASYFGRESAAVGNLPE